MNFNGKLINFAQNELVLGRTDSERSSINASLGELEKKLKDKLGSEVVQIKRFGSYSRNTILPRRYDVESDVDLMVIFNTSDRTKTPGTYRNKLQNILSTAYPNSIVKKDFPVVKVELGHIIFDVVPAIRKEHWFSSDSLNIPSDNDSWIETNPDDVKQNLENANTKFGNNTVRNVVRLCKCWNAGKGYPFDSYLMELKITGLNFSGDDTYKGFKYALKNVAGHLPGVNQALGFIDQYESEGKPEKVLEWLKKLLPGLV